MGFFRRRLPEVTNEAYARWLRARQPPWLWFLGLPEDAQEQVALMGDEYSQDIAVAIGTAVADPELASASVSAARGDQDAEATLATRVAEGLVAKILAARGSETPSTPPFQMPTETLGGLGKRKQAANGPAVGPTGSMFGKAPDEVDP